MVFLLVGDEALDGGPDACAATIAPRRQRSKQREGRLVRGSSLWASSISRLSRKGRRQGACRARVSLPLLTGSHRRHVSAIFTPTGSRAAPAGGRRGGGAGTETPGGRPPPPPPPITAPPHA